MLKPTQAYINAFCLLRQFIAYLYTAEDDVLAFDAGRRSAQIELINKDEVTNTY